MAAELTTTKLNPDTHLFLDQPLLRLPHELIRRNFKTNQRYVEREKEYLLPALKETAHASLSSSRTPDQTLSALDAMIARMQTFKRKLQTLQEEEQAIQSSSKKRIQHLQDLYEIPNLADVKYDDWSRKRLDRLLVDYLLRGGYMASADNLAQAKGIEDLVDLEVFRQCHGVAEKLERGEVREALVWCAENRTALKKMGQNDLEFELRLQQYIEMVRTGTPAKQQEARQHAMKFLIPYKETHWEDISKAAGLLAYRPDTVIEPYKSLYSSARYINLSNLFTTTHHALHSLPSRPLLHVALSAGLSALKTPSCHSSYTSSSSNSSSTLTSVCPICSTELNELARNVPYAHHTKSHVEHDPVVLPNGRIYGRERLWGMQRKLRFVGHGPGGDGARGRGSAYGNWNEDDGEEEVRDPTTGELFAVHDVRKVYIT